MTTSELQKHQFICGGCGVVFTDKKHPRRKFCTRECKTKHAPRPRADRIVRDCEECGQRIDMEKRNLKTRRFCSPSCASRANNRTHGLSRSKLHRKWAQMKARCLNPRNKSYDNYGGRGIRVCDEWIVSFEAFRDWAMANGFREDLELDRIDVNGNYSPVNCRFVDEVTQARNQRKRRGTLSRFRGVSMQKNHIRERWMAHITVNKKTLYLGTFNTELEAAEAYRTAAKEHFDEAYPNERVD